MEGKDWPHKREPKDFRLLGNNFGLMLLMCEPIFGSVKCAVFDSGFFVAECIVDLKYRGDYGAALIKKWQ